MGSCRIWLEAQHGYEISHFISSGYAHVRTATLTLPITRAHQLARTSCNGTCQPPTAYAGLSHTWSPPSVARPAQVHTEDSRIRWKFVKVLNKALPSLVCAQLRAGLDMP